MGKMQSFAEILNEKQSFQETNQRDFKEFHSEPAYLSFLMGQISPLKKVAPKQLYPHKPYIPKPHSLSPAQQNSWNWFLNQGMALTSHYNMKELKKAFRTLALRLHPDHQGGCAESFRELKSHFDLLCLVHKRASA